MAVIKKLKIALINPLGKGQTRMPIPPYGLAALIQYYQRYGRNNDEVCFRLFDENGTGQDLLEGIVEWRPDLVGVGTMSLTRDRAYQLAQKMKAEVPEVLCLGGGVHFQICPEEIKNESGFDLACTGEGEKTLLGIIDEYLLNGRKPKTLDMIPNLFYKDNEKGWVRTSSWVVDDLNEVPLPDLSVFHLTYYLRKRTFIPAVIAVSASIMTSRGCPFKCSYCFNSFYSGKVRYYAISVVVDYMKALREQYGVNHFVIMDDLFVMDKARVNEFCVEVLNRIPGIQWVCNARPNLLKEQDLPMLKLMRRAGCVHMSLGFESGSDEVLRKIRGAGSSVAANQKALEVISCSGIDVFGFFMCGIPGETEAQMRMTGAFIDKNVSLMRHYELFIYTPFPGSVLAGIVEKEGLLTGVSMNELALNVFSQGTPRVFNPLVPKDIILAFRREYKKKTMEKYSWKDKIKWLVVEGIDNPLRTLRRIMELYGSRN